MIPSLNEIEMMVWKAARGAGLSWGLAEEMGQAARWLADHGFDWAPSLAAALEEAERLDGELPPPVLSDGAWQPADAVAATSAVLCGPLLSDLAGGLTETQPVRLARVAHPLLMLPFAARSARDLGLGLALSIDGAAFSFSGDRAAGTALPAELKLAEEVMLALHGPFGTPPQGPIPGAAPRRAIPAQPLARLEAWVHRTYVPASAQSRLAGAGAGLTDND